MAEDDWHETKIRVRYKDTDRMGVVYYGNYLTFFEAGRSEFMRDFVSLLQVRGARLLYGHNGGYC